MEAPKVSRLFLKAGVVVPPSLRIAAVLINTASELALGPMYITSGSDGTHRPNSKHYTNAALDFRTKHLSHDDRQRLVNRVRENLGPDYDVVMEAVGQLNEHLHIEYDPKHAHV